jgi:cobalt-zinc-cadmium efflux system outer membrane protein
MAVRLIIKFPEKPMHRCDHVSPRRSRILAAPWLIALSMMCAPSATACRPDQTVPTNGMPERLSLAEAKRLAFERNWDFLAAKADVDIAAAQEIIAREFPNPSFAWSTAKVPINGHSAATLEGRALWDRSYDTILSINQLFEIGGKRRSRQVSAEQGFRAEKARFADARRILDLGVTKAYVAALQAALNAQTLRDSAVSLHHEADIAAARLQAGDISTADKSQIEILADRFNLDSQAADADAMQKRIAMENLIGTAVPTGHWVAADTLENLIEPKIAESDNKENPRRPDLIAAEASLKKAEADLRLQNAMRIPDFTLLFLYEHNPPDGDQTVGLGLSFSLPLWNHNRGEIEATAAACQQASVQVDKIRGQIAADIASARVAYREASARYENYTRVIRPKSAQIVKTISYAYEKGGASLLDLLVAQRNDNEVRLAAVQAGADVAIAQAALKTALTAAEASLTTRNER